MDSTVLTFDTHTSHSKVYGRWQGHVEYKNGQTEIELNNLKDDTFEGTYRCEVSTPEFRHLEETIILQQYPARTCLSRPTQQSYKILHIKWSPDID